MASANGTRQRLDWPDVAKGLSIVGVVLLHVSLAVPEGMDTVAAQINRILDPLRMPLFFLVSGFFSAKVFRFSFADLFQRRLWFFLVPYLVWGPVELWLKFREYHMFDHSPMPALSVYVDQLTVGKSMYWFLYALVVFNVILWLTRKLPTWAGIAVGFAPILILPLHLDYHMVGKAVLYLPAFLIGAHLRERIGTFAAEGASLRNIVNASALYVAAFAASAAWAWYNLQHELVLPWLLPGAETVGFVDLRLIVNSLIQVAMLPMAILVAVLLARIPVLADVLKFLGRHTLVIYLGHALGLTVLYHYNLRGMDLVITRDADVWTSSTAFWMVIATVAAVAGSLFLWLLTRVPYVRWTLMPPPLARAARSGATSTVAAEPARPERGDAVVPGARTPGA